MWRKCLRLFGVFLKIGALTIGSGYAMLPIMRLEFTQKRDWLTEEEMTDILGLSQSIPGLIAANTASLIGYKLAGFPGAFFGTLGAVLPSFIIILIIAVLFPHIASNIYVQKALKGVEVGVTATIIAYAVHACRKTLVDIFSVVVMLASFALGLFTHINLFFIITGGALLGWIYHTIRRTKHASDR